MEQFEKVVKGLELTKSNPVEGWDYRGEGFDGAMVHTSTALIDAALVLIRQQQARIAELEAAQTARVMSPEEIKEYLMINESGLLSEQQWEELEQKAPVYFEFRIPDRYQVNWRTAVMLRPWVMESMFWDNYNKDRRCWTKRPTDEQREAVKWDE